MRCYASGEHKGNICAFAHILGISQSFGAACNIFLVEAPAEFGYAPVFCEKTPFSCLKQRCLLGTVHHLGGGNYLLLILFFQL